MKMTANQRLIFKELVLMSSFLLSLRFDLDRELDFIQGKCQNSLLISHIK